ncbi:type IV pilus twitching motility protein PilT [Amorphus sp. 3PC139-8]|uniref:type IV pilus twitching motility protein PilT n=1 Tax=Amorphus sp. 3PC139-8 TaxID=2735676 RepID=UPI00345D6608
MIDVGREPGPIVSSMRVREGVDQAEPFAVSVDATSVRALKEEPQRLDEPSFRRFLMSCVQSNASDITIQSGIQPRCEIYGRKYRASRRAWTTTDVNMVLAELYGDANAVAEINRGEVLDFSYELTQADGIRQRFRVNATGIFGREGAGVEITIRVLPTKTPTWESVSLTEDIADAVLANNGVIVICGATGHGKSTTMAAMTRRWLEWKERPVKIVDLQAPIEYTYRDVLADMEGSASIIGQSEIPRHVKTFAEGVRSALRRNPDIINVGECRDLPTIQATIEASLTGHLVYTTTHAGSVVEALRRLVMVFPGEQREGESFNLLTSLRFLMVQFLVERSDEPGRVPVREYLQITPELRSELYNRHTDRWPEIVSELMASDGDGGPMRRRLEADVESYFRRGVISEDSRRMLMALQSWKGRGDVR